MQARGRKRLPKTDILRSKKQIALLFKHGRAMRTPYFNLVYQKRPGEKQVLFATSKGLKPHTARNFAKRRLRELYRVSKERDDLQHLHIAFIAKPSSVTAAYALLNQEFSRAMKKLAQA